MRLRFLPVPLLTILVGCASGSPGSIAFDSPAQLRAEDSLDLCGAYGLNHGSAVLEELQRRGAIRPQFLALIKAQQVAIGMSPCEVLAAWQRPSNISRSITAAGTRERWTYRGLSGQKIGAVYLTNDIVTLIQN